jgi:hypothetical protein
MLNKAISFAIVAEFISFFAFADITSLHLLNAAIEKGPNRQVGFLSIGNYLAVQSVLSKNVVPVYINDTSKINKQIDAKVLLAGLINGVPLSKYNSFASTIISTASMLTNPNDTILGRVLG